MKIKRIGIIAFVLCLLFTGVAYCDVSVESEAQTIEALSQKVLDLETRLEKLELILLDKNLNQVSVIASGKISLSVFDLVEVGDTYDEAMAKVGFKGKISSENSYTIGDRTTVIKTMKYDGNGTGYTSKASITFENNVVTGKTQRGLD